MSRTASHRESSFDRAILLLSQAEQRGVRDVLARWASQTRTGRVIAANLDPLERFLPPSAMKELLLALHRHRNADFHVLADAYQALCWKQTLQGGNVELATMPRRLGRAVERETFVNHLVLHARRHFSSRRQADDFVDRLVLGGALDPHEHDIPMSRYASWVTWHDDPDGDPFAFSGNDAETVRACLGLDPHRRSTSGLLLLTYELADGWVLLRPTVADAGLSLFFAPPPVGLDAHGLTRPWPPGVSGIVEPTPRPEALHRSHDVSTLELPVRQLS